MIKSLEVNLIVLYASLVTIKLRWSRNRNRSTRWRMRSKTCNLKPNTMRV